MTELTVNKANAIADIRQKDAHSFTIDWTDGLSQDFRLSDLQRNCPCAACVDEVTGERRTSAEQISKNVSATRLQSVGRYGLRVLFATGCSQGIYSFDLLRTIGEPKELSS